MRNKHENEPEKTTVFADAKTAAEEKVRSIQEKARAIREKKLAAGKILTLQSYWFEQVREHFPKAHIVGWTRRDEIKFAKLFKDRLPGIDRQKFISVVVSQWVEIKRNKFPRMSTAPDYPDFGFVIRFANEFESGNLR
jgi:hypothetical protein